MLYAAQSLYGYKEPYDVQNKSLYCGPKAANIMLQICTWQLKFQFQEQ